MAGDEYSAVGGGGKLKLKGSKVKDGRVEKKKKRKEKGKEKDISDDSRARDDSTAKDDPARNEEGPEASRRHGDSADTGDQEHGKEGRVIYKTEAERKYEEQRKKRVCLGRFTLAASNTKSCISSSMNDFDAKVLKPIRSASKSSTDISVV
jgi:protein FAM32A